MNISEYIDAITRQHRQGKFSNSPQLTLGEIIDKLEKIGTKTDEGKDKTIKFDFGSAIPTTLDSWRGAYHELALGYELSWYDGECDWENTTAEKLLQEFKSAVGKYYTGWKGGEFKMTRDTPVGVANHGNSDNTGIVDIVDDSYRVIIMTTYCEY